MRYTFYATIVALSVICCPAGATAEGPASWLWPFGGQQSADDASSVAAPTPTHRSTAVASTTGTPADRSDFKLPRYEPHLPSLSLPRLWPSKEPTDEARNAWVKPDAEPEQASPWQVVTDGAHRLGTGTRNAWHKTVDVLNPFDGADQPVAHQQPQPSFWSRLFRPEDNEHQGARTITEWMAQERLDP